MKDQDEGWQGDSPFGLRRFGAEFIQVGHDALDAYRRRNPPTLLDQHAGEVGVSVRLRGGPRPSRSGTYRRG